MTQYHDPESCNKCGLMSNRFLRGNFHDGEIDTKCVSCGHRDYWFWGFFQSGEGKCATFSFKRDE